MIISPYIPPGAETNMRYKHRCLSGVAVIMVQRLLHRPITHPTLDLDDVVGVIAWHINTADKLLYDNKIWRLPFRLVLSVIKMQLNKNYPIWHYLLLIHNLYCPTSIYYSRGILTLQSPVSIVFGFLLFHYLIKY